MCQLPARQRFLAAKTGSRSVDYAVPRPKRREPYGDERRSATTKDLPSTTRCWIKVTMRAGARKRQAMVQMTTRQHCNVHLANRRECRVGRSLAGTSCLQLSSCRALVLDGTKGLQDMFLSKRVWEASTSDETCEA